MTLPLSVRPGSMSKLVCLRISRRFEFDSSLMRSGAVAIDQASGVPLLFVRGAPSKVQGLITPARLPSDFDQVNYASTGWTTAGLHLHWLRSYAKMMLQDCRTRSASETISALF